MAESESALSSGEFEESLPRRILKKYLPGEDTSLRWTSTDSTGSASRPSSSAGNFSTMPRWNGSNGQQEAQYAFFSWALQNVASSWQLSLAQGIRIVIAGFEASVNVCWGSGNANEHNLKRRLVSIQHSLGRLQWGAKTKVRRAPSQSRLEKGRLHGVRGLEDCAEI